MEDQKRKKNKEETKRLLINAVGEIIRTKGFAGLGVNKIARQAGVAKKLIYVYFNTPEKLIERYVVEKDYWMLFSEKLQEEPEHQIADLHGTISDILENQFDFFFSEKEMQQLILWELSGESELMKSISVAREDLGNKFLVQTDEYFKKSDINFRALSALLTAGIYYMILHAHITEYCGIDLKKAEDRQEVKRTIRQVLAWAFKQVKARAK